MEKAIETLVMKEYGRTVYVNAFYELDLPDIDVDREGGRLDAEAFNRGDLLNLCLEVKTFDASGEVAGYDVLGGVLVNSNTVLEDIQEIIKAHDMINAAIVDLERRLGEIREAKRRALENAKAEGRNE